MQALSKCHDAISNRAAYVVPLCEVAAIFSTYVMLFQTSRPRLYTALWVGAMAPAGRKIVVVQTKGKDTAVAKPSIRVGLGRALVAVAGGALLSKAITTRSFLYMGAVALYGAIVIADRRSTYLQTLSHLFSGDVCGATAWMKSTDYRKPFHRDFVPA